MKYSDAFRATMKSLLIPMLILIIICIVASSWSLRSPFAYGKNVETFDTAGSAVSDPSVLATAGGANAVSVPTDSANTSGIVPLVLPSVASPPPGVMQTPGTPAVPSPTQAPVTAPAAFPSLTGTTTPLVDPAASQLPSSAPNVANSVPPIAPIIPGVLPNTSTTVSSSAGLNGLAQLSQTSTDYPSLTTPTAQTTAALTLPGQGNPTLSSPNMSTIPSQLNSSSIPGLDFNASSSVPTMPATGISTNASTSMPASFSATLTNSSSPGLTPGLTTVIGPSAASSNNLSAVNPPLTSDATKPTPLTVWNTGDVSQVSNGTQPSLPPALAGNGNSGVKPYADTSKEAYDLQRYAPLFDELNDVQKELFDNVQRLRNVSGKIRSQYVPSYPLPLMEVSAGY